MAILRFGAVFLKDVPAGILRETPEGGTVFTYDEAYRRAPGAAPVGVSLPLSQQAHDWRNGLHPYFQHLGPEGGLRQRQAAWSQVNVDDDLGLLLTHGADCIGAVSIIDPEVRPAAVPTAFGGVAEDPARWLGHRTISGVQPKFLARKTAAGFVPAGDVDVAPYIAKLPSDGLPGLVANEDFTLRLCRRLLGATEVAEAERGVVEGFAGQVLLVRRFDRTPANEKLRLEDFAQVLLRPRGQDFNGKYQASYEECADVVRRHSVQPRIDLARFFKRLLAQALLGNCDAHLKNFSLLESPAGLRLSPLYDAVNTYYYAPNISGAFGLELDGARRQWDTLDRPLFERFGAGVGLKATLVRRVFAELSAQRDAVFDDLRQRNPLPGDEGKQRYEDVVRSAWLRLFPG